MSCKLYLALYPATCTQYERMTDTTSAARDVDRDRNESRWFPVRPRLADHCHRPSLMFNRKTGYK